MPSAWLRMPVTPRSSRTARARPRTRRLPTLPSAPAPVKSRPGPPAAPIACASTTNCCASRKSSGRPRDTLARLPFGRACPQRTARSRKGFSRATMHTLVLLRHGESTWNRENRFTGWTDVPLSERGVEEARAAGRTLAQEGYGFDVAYTSLLKRAIKTLWLALEELELMWIPIHDSWRLNERHYGALQGLDKAETAQRHGLEQTEIWRRSYDIRPPALAPDDPRSPARDPRYADLSPAELPLTECLKDTVERFLPY